MGRLDSISLERFLEIKPLYYEEIDYTYFPSLWSRIQGNFDIKARVVHVIGTNGKGSTSKTLHHCLSNHHVSVGTYNSPEFFSFQDMFNINNTLVEIEELNRAHTFLQRVMPINDLEKISRFEYTTLMAFKVFQDCDFMILEAGLGGEYDATNVLKKELSIISPIDIDHIKFLGSTIEDITNTKLRSVKNKLVSAKQVHAISEKIINNYKIKYNKIEEKLTNKDILYIKQFEAANKIPRFMGENIELAVEAFKTLGFKFNSETLKGLLFKGRFQKVKRNIILDVGHNPIAAKKIFDNISNNTILIYNSYADKDYLKIIKILSPKLKKVILIDVPDKRVCRTSEILEKLKPSSVNVSIMRNDFHIISDENYLVFGSFSVVKEFTIRFL